MKTFDNNEFETYKQEVREKWGETTQYKQYADKTENYSKDKWNSITGRMFEIVAEFSDCMKKGDEPKSLKVQNLVKTLQNHISENYYLCSNEVLSGLGQMYVADERFRKNIDKSGEGTADYIRKAIQVYCEN